MGININTNINALIAKQNVGSVNKELKTNMSKLSSGLRVNSAGDDAAGLARADQLRSQTRGIQTAMRNTNDGMSALEIADSAAGSISEILARMGELAVGAANGALSDAERGYLNEEFQTLYSELGRITQTTEFGGKRLLDGSSATLDLQIGEGAGGGNQLNVALANLSPATIAPTLGVGIGTQADAQSAIDDISAALKDVNDARTVFGATSNRLGVIAENLSAANVNFQAAESRIRDLDYANETARRTGNSIREQAAIAVQAQANLQPQSVLKLLGS